MILIVICSMPAHLTACEYTRAGQCIPTEPFSPNGLIHVRNGFTEEELDFIINYDIKYRMGDELESDE